MSGQEGKAPATTPPHQVGEDAALSGSDHVSATIQGDECARNGRVELADAAPDGGPSASTPTGMSHFGDGGGSEGLGRHASPLPSGTHSSVAQHTSESVGGKGDTPRGDPPVEMVSSGSAPELENAAEGAGGDAHHTKEDMMAAWLPVAPAQVPPGHVELGRRGGDAQGPAHRGEVRRTGGERGGNKDESRATSDALDDVAGLSGRGADVHGGERQRDIHDGDEERDASRMGRQGSRGGEPGKPGGRGKGAARAQQGSAELVREAAHRAMARGVQRRRGDQGRSGGARRSADRRPPRGTRSWSATATRAGCTRRA